MSKTNYSFHNFIRIQAPPRTNIFKKSKKEKKLKLESTPKEEAKVFIISFFSWKIGVVDGRDSDDFPRGVKVFEIP